MWCALYRNRAIHDDLVAVRLLPKSEWRGRGSILPQDGDDGASESADVMATGQVVAILERRPREYVASFTVGEAVSMWWVLFGANNACCLDNSRRVQSTQEGGLNECWCVRTMCVFPRSESAHGNLKN